MAPSIPAGRSSTVPPSGRNRLGLVPNAALKLRASVQRSRPYKRSSPGTEGQAAGSAAIDLCYVAAGRMDGFWESDLKPWDMAAGALIVAEAGGRVTNMDGTSFNSRRPHVLATNGLLHEQMLGIIERFRRGRALERTD